MQKTTFFFILFIVLIFSVMACGGTAASPTPTIQPTNTVPAVFTFTHPYGLYSVQSPTGWQATITERAPADAEVSFTSPEYQLSSGYPVLEKGAEFLIQTKLLAEGISSVEEYYQNDPLFKSVARNVTQITVAGVPAVQFDYSYEGVEAMMTTLIAQGRLFQMRYRYVDTVAKEQYLADYQAFVNSILIAGKK